MQNEDQLILVDSRDRQIGALGKLETHQKGLLHRAFSIFVRNNKGELLLQRRALGKYHSGGLWTNTCCGHPKDGEELAAAVHRRLREEMGFDCPLTERAALTYQVDLNKGLQEHEFLHIFTGVYDGSPVPNPEEASEWKCMTLAAIVSDVAEHPGSYTEWFKIILEEMRKSRLALD